MLASLTTSGLLHGMCADISSVVQASQSRLTNALAELLDEAEQLTALIPPEALETPSACYTRHLVHADKQGQYSVMLLVWHPGQYSPVHGHKTWCIYKVLQGVLTEHHYAFDAADDTAKLCGQATRRPGDLISAHAGLDNIHRLSNAGDRVAVSLHIYGVEREQINTHVNWLVPEG